MKILGSISSFYGIVTRKMVHIKSFTIFQDNVAFMWLIFVCAYLQIHLPVLSSPESSKTRVILFIIDGLSVEAPARIAMPHWQNLAKEGCVFQEMHLPLPGHPKNDPRYPWSCSMPNPMMMSGTPFIGKKSLRESMIQHQFSGAESAFVVNAYSYKDVSEGFGTYISKPHKPDALSVQLAQEVILKHRPDFIRVHLQRPGIEGEKISKEKYSNKAYYRNIWHIDSPYRRAVEHADSLLGEFVNWLHVNNFWRDTVIMVCGDHGQADEGWHEPYSISSSKTPLLMVGKGVCKKKSVDYCEIFDIAPTISYLTGRSTPPFSIGRVLKEAFARESSAHDTSHLVERLNISLRAAHSLGHDAKILLSKAGFLTIDELGLWHNSPAKDDFPAFVSRQEQILNEFR